MKKSFLLIAAAAFAVGAMFSSCGPKSVAKIAGEREVSVPCADFSTDDKFFRGVGTAQSGDLNTARERARMAANTELATSMSAVIKSVSERYVNDAGVTAADFAQLFEGLTRQVVNQQINNVRVACNQTNQTQDGTMYRVYMAVEASKEEVLAELQRQAAADQRIQTLFDRERFRQSYEAEMAEFASNR